jgi:hypothetical protein
VEIDFGLLERGHGRNGAVVRQIGIVNPGKQEFDREGRVYHLCSKLLMLFRHVSYDRC